jgi:UDP-glucose 4-epimerase
MKRRVLITGALGHIGSKLIRTLPTSVECEIIMMDDMLTQRYGSLYDLPSQYKYNFIEGDILKCDLNDLFKGVTHVIHLAAITTAASSFNNQQEVENVNYIGTNKVIDACIANKCKLIFLSTTSIYATENNVVDENCSLVELNPQSPYAESKYKSELRLNEYKDKLDFVILRLGTIFGSSIGMRFHTAVNKFCWQAVMGLPLTVWKTAYKQKRPYLDLDDAVRSIAFIIEKNLFGHEIYNVLTENFTVEDIIKTIEAYVNTVKIDYVEADIMNQLSYDVSNEKFKKTGFTFRGNKETSIAKVVGMLKTSNAGDAGFIFNDLH